MREDYCFLEIGINKCSKHEVTLDEFEKIESKIVQYYGNVEWTERMLGNENMGWTIGVVEIRFSDFLEDLSLEYPNVIFMATAVLNDGVMSCFFCNGDFQQICSDFSEPFTKPALNDRGEMQCQLYR